MGKKKRNKKKSKKTKKTKRKKSKKVVKSRKKSRKVKKSRKKKSKKRRKLKSKKTKSKKKRKSKSRKPKSRGKSFKAPKILEDGDGKSLIKVSDSWSNQAYVNESQYKKKYKLSIKENDKFWAKEGKRISWIKNREKKHLKLKMTTRAPPEICLATLKKP